jgi:hypothetical protein
MSAEESYSGSEICKVGVRRQVFTPMARALSLLGHVRFSLRSTVVRPATSRGGIHGKARVRTGLRFPDFAYIVEVQLIKNDASGHPGVLGLQFFHDQA